MSNTIGERIRIMRAIRGMSQKELAERLGKSANVITHWERGRNSPDVDSIEKLCEILTVSPNYLMGWEDKDEITTIAAHHNGDEYTPEELEAIDLFKQYVKDKKRERVHKELK